MFLKQKSPIRLLLLLGLCIALPIYAQDEIKGDAANGEKLFKANCTACHALDRQLVGPALKGVVTRLKQEQGLGRDWLQKWIKDNVALRASGDKYANEIFLKYNKSEMQQFPNLSEQDIDDILTYLENPPAPEEEKKEEAVAVVSSEEDAKFKKLVLISFGVLAAIFIWILIRVNTLVNLIYKKTPELSPVRERQVITIGEFYSKYRKFSHAVIAAFSVFLLYAFWASLMGIGVDKGYKPDQPIYFSHKIHSGIQGIDCQFCHSSARYGKFSEIPSLNLCMNCHRNIAEYKGDYVEPGLSKDFYTQEIKKIYAHIGWDEENQKYTGVSKPVKWVRIHNMPDFVHFNHAQHVVAGEKSIINYHNKKYPDDKIDVVCKACHGKIDTMNVAQMANDFTMGWCIECHRNAEVDLTNKYNSAYYKNLHEKLKKEYSGKKFTVENIGGLECGKCHY